MAKQVTVLEETNTVQTMEHLASRWINQISLIPNAFQFTSESTSPFKTRQRQMHSAPLFVNTG